MKLSKYSFAAFIAFPVFLVSAVPFLIGKPVSQVVIYILFGLLICAGVFLLLTWFSCRLGVSESRCWLYFLPATVLSLISSFLLGKNNLLLFFAIGLLMVAAQLTSELKRAPKPSFLKFIIPLLSASLAPSAFAFVLVYSEIVPYKDIYMTVNSVLPVSLFLFVISYTFGRFVTARRKTHDDVIYIDSDDYSEK